MFDAEDDRKLRTADPKYLSRGNGSIYTKSGKRAFDLSLVVFLSPILIFVIAILALLIRLQGGSAFFGHHRVGMDGKIFKCWKLRTMVPNAEDRLREHLSMNIEAQRYWQANFKLLKDPRVTRLGKILRKASLDELPQFWNVLIGDMSVVGPRPVTVEETALYGMVAADIQRVRPGITGLWQVSGRNDLTYDQRVAFDLTYLQDISLVQDISIVLRTVKVMLLRTGI